MVLKNLSVWFFVFLASVSEFSFARDIDFDVTQRVVANGTIISVVPNDRVRPEDLLVVLDSSDDRSQGSIILFRDSDGDGRPDGIRFLVPKQIRRSIDVSIVPVNAADSSVYCGVGGQWHGEFEGSKGKSGIRFLGNPTFRVNLACRDGVLGPNLRLENGSVVAGSIQSQDGVTLSTYMCQKASDTVSDECQKKEVADGLGLVAFPVSDVSSACSVLARVIYASDRGRIIASEEDAIRVGGLCPEEGKAFSFDPGNHRVRASSIARSTIDWVVQKISKALGKKTAKKAEKAIRGCDIPPGLFWKIVDAIPYVGGLLVPCLAGG